MRGKLRIAVLVVALYPSAFALRLFDSFAETVLPAHNVNWKIVVTRQVAVDFYGCVMPTAISVLLVLCLVFLAGFPFRRYLRFFLVAVVFALVSSRRGDAAVTVAYFSLVVSVSFLAAFISFYKGTLRELAKLRGLRRLEFTRGNYASAVLTGTTYASLSVLAVDLAYALFAPFAGANYFGGMGLTDGILLSGLLAPLGVTFATLFMRLVHESLCQLLSNPDKHENENAVGSASRVSTAA